MNFIISKKLALQNWRLPGSAREDMIYHRIRKIKIIMKRREGFYWVKYNSEWLIGFYNEVEQAFEMTMSDCYYPLYEFDEIDEFPIVRN